MSIALQADSSLPQGYILINGATAATVKQDGTLVIPTLSATNISAAGITFTGAIVGNLTGTASAIADGSVSTTAKLANGIVTAAKLGTNEQKQIAKVWVNFDGTTAGTWAGGASTVTRTAGSTTATVTTTNPHGLVTNNTVYAQTGVAAGSYVVTVLTPTTFTITTAATTALSAVAITFAVLNIRSSLNVANVMKIGNGGTYAVNMSVAQPDSVFCVVATCFYGAGTADFTAQVTSKTNSSFTVRVGSDTLNGNDATEVSAVVFGN